MHSPVLLAATLTSTLITIALFFIITWINNIRQKKETWDETNSDPSNPPGPRDPTTSPRPTAGPVLDWQEELRRILRDSRTPSNPPSLPPAPRPQPASRTATPKPVPVPRPLSLPQPPRTATVQAEEGPEAEFPVLQESKQAYETGRGLEERVAERLRRVSSHLGSSQEAEQSMAEAEQIPSQATTRIHQAITGPLQPSESTSMSYGAGNVSAKALSVNLGSPDAQKQALLASIILGAPRALDPI